MPIYVYKAKNTKKACSYCRQGFEILQKTNDAILCHCPKCGASIDRVFAPFAQGYSKTGFDSKAKEKGFHKLKRVDKGKYEKLY